MSSSASSSSSTIQENLEPDTGYPLSKKVLPSFAAHLKSLTLGSGTQLSSTVAHEFIRQVFQCYNLERSDAESFLNPHFMLSLLILKKVLIPTKYVADIMNELKNVPETIKQEWADACAIATDSFNQKSDAQKSQRHRIIANALSFSTLTSLNKNLETQEGGTTRMEVYNEIYAVAMEEHTGSGPNMKYPGVNVLKQFSRLQHELKQILLNVLTQDKGCLSTAVTETLKLNQSQDNFMDDRQQYKFFSLAQVGCCYREP